MSLAAHVFAALTTLPCLFLILRLVRADQLRVKYAAMWVVIGTFMASLAIVPQLLNWASRGLGISYPPALLFLVSTVLLLFIAVHFSWELSRLEERTRTLAEEMALLRAELYERTDESARDVHASAVVAGDARPSVHL